jgi:hypothetical protein
MNASDSMMDSYGMKVSGKMKASNKASKGLVVGFWIFTALFCLEMSFTAY